MTVSAPQLFVISRDRMDLYRELSSLFEENEHVKVVLDRRIGQRAMNSDRVILFGDEA